MSILKASWVKQSIRLFLHELKRGELTIIILAIVLGVASVFSLAGFSGQIKQALINESTSFIAADRILQSSRPLSAQESEPLNLTAMQEQSKQLDIARAEQVLMSSMVFAGDNMQLVELVAVSPKYPLRGELLVRKNANTGAVETKHAPAQGTVFVEDKILSLLQVAVGDSLEIGNTSLVIAGIAEQIPDASFSVFTSGVKVIVNIADLKATNLIQPGSRVTYKYLFAGSTNNINKLDEWLKPKINDAQRWYDIQSRQSPLANALNRAEKYLSLASLLGIILAAVAVSVASRRYGQKHQSSVAVYKAMGASLAHIRKLYALHWASLSLFSIVIGLVFGYLLAQLGLYAIQDYLPIQVAQTATDVADTSVFSLTLVPLGIYPLVMAVLTGLVCAIAFALTPLKQLIATSPLAALRDENTLVKKDGLTARFWQVLPPLSALFLLLVLFSRSIMLSVSLLLAGILVSALLLVIGRMLMSVSRVVGSKSGAAWHLAMANLKRRAAANSVQLVSFTIAIKLLLMIVVIKSALLSEWQAQLPEQAPNLFLVNIANEQTQEVEHFINQNGIVASDLYAVIRGRLTAINTDIIAKQVTKEQDEGNDNGRQGVGRELNLTWRTQLPKENTIAQGAWWSEQSTNAEVSIEESLAKRLQIKLGDTLTFQLGSDTIQVPVTSIRTVNWQSMQPNFYMIFSPAVLADFPASYIASLYVSKDKKQLMQQFLVNYPTISLIDIDGMIEQLRKVIEQVSTAVEFILVLVVLAGCLVLVAQVQASMEEREREIAILRTIGAKGALLRNSVLFEFIALGAIAGLMASVAMELTVYLLQANLFNMQTSFHFDFWLLGILAGACFVGLVGLLSCWRLINMPSVTLIRRTM
ncbi:MAG: FtsX-like permease family protein [Colwellia sp.]|nr:FtsX-like permease family protein [Colwellia sp.]MCW8864494.1 FtsX-like permease family protein [Colwellia sp.]MCW9081058.1 FtsX-like permease family protein [Colwellia sp.]